MRGEPRAARLVGAFKSGSSVSRRSTFKAKLATLDALSSGTSAILLGSTSGDVCLEYLFPRRVHHIHTKQHSKPSDAVTSTPRMKPITLTSFESACITCWSPVMTTASGVKLVGVSSPLGNSTVRSSITCSPIQMLIPSRMCPCETSSRARNSCSKLACPSEALSIEA